MAPKDVWTIEKLADAEVFDGVALSHDATKVAYVVRRKYRHHKDEYTKSAIWLADVGKEGSARQFTAGHSHDSQPQWAADNSTLYFVSDRHAPGKAKQLYSLSLSGGEAIALTSTQHEEGVGDDFSVSPDGNFIAFLSKDEPSAQDEAQKKEKAEVHVYDDPKEFAKLRVLTLSTGRVRTMHALADRTISSFSWSADSKSIFFRPTRYSIWEYTTYELDLWKWVITDHQPKPIEKWEMMMDGSQCFEAKSGQLYVSGALENAILSTKVLWRLHEGGKKQSFFGKTDSTGTFKRLLHDKVDAVIAVAEGISTRFYAIPSDDGQPVLLAQDESNDEFSIGDRIWDIKRSGEDYVFVFSAQSNSSPYQLFSARISPSSHPNDIQKISVRLSHHNQALEVKGTGLKRALWKWTGKDGAQVEGIVTFPANATSEKPERPTKCLLHIHGGPFGRDVFADPTHSGTFVPHIFAARGFLVLQPNYRGGSGRGEAWAADANGGMGVNDWNDCLSMVEHAIEQGFADPNKLAVCGWSQGGFLTAKAVSATKNMFKAGIVGAGVTHFPSLAVTTDVPDFEGVLSGDAPWDNHIGNVQANPIFGVEGVETAVLIIHGEKDARVTPNQAIGFYRGLVRKGKYPDRVKLVMYGGEPHGFEKRAHFVDYMQRTLEWLTMWVG